MSQTKDRRPKTKCFRIKSHKTNPFKLAGIFLGVTLVFFAGCDNMRDGNRLKPYEASSFFEDGSSSRPLIEGTVPRNFLNADEAFYTGKKDGKHVEKSPAKVTKESILKGQERYNIYCVLCHGDLGKGDGMVVKRGFKQPTSFHDERLLKAADGYYFDVMTNGYGAMLPYKAEVTPEERWAIVSYIRALQLSQNVNVKELSIAEKKLLDKKPTEKHESKGKHH